MIGIIGAGVMGKGIAIEFARNNNDVVLVSAQRNLDVNSLKEEVQNIISKFELENSIEIFSKIKFANKFEDLHGCSLIIEAVSENLHTKQSVINKVSQYTSKNTVFASNTSSLSIRKVFEGIIDIRNVIGLHFFNPVQVMKLVELSYLEESNDEKIALIKDLLNSLGKKVVIVKDSPGFIVNRLLIPMINEAAKILDEGIASEEDIDKAMKYGANHPIGPLKLSDLIGNDVTLAILESLEDYLPDKKISTKIIELNKEDNLGRKSKKGFYDYN